MTDVHLRNVDVPTGTPLGDWPLEGLRTLLERGNITAYRALVADIKREPWGPAARRVEQVLQWTQPYGATRIMQRAIANARARHKADEIASVTTQLRRSLEISGLSQAEFAKRLGTSPSRFSTYLHGSVVPAATLLARAHAVSARIAALREVQ